MLYDEPKIDALCPVALGDSEKVLCHNPTTLRAYHVLDYV